MNNVQVTLGDIALIPADALITAINSAGEWFGGIDSVIARNAGEMFHQQVADVMPLINGQTIVAKKTAEHNGAFKNVVFVVDDRVSRLSHVVYNGLQAASDAGFVSVTLPAIRMGVMLGVVEKTVDEAVREIADGIRSFYLDNPDSNLTDVKVVIYDDPYTKIKLEKLLTNH